MKRILLMLFLLSVAYILSAQDVTGVAIMKTVDEVGDVSQGVKLNLRATLAYAINHMPGYEAYTRVNMSAIMDEHKFQRTGFVSDNQIKAIGKATGAKYILIAEVAYFDEKNITVTASIVDIETTRLKATADPEISPVEPAGMRKSCIKIARSLLNLQEESIEGSPQPRYPGNGGSSQGGQDFTETAFGINMKMVYVEGGTFVMGCTSEQGDDCDDDEKNVRKVTLDSYYIGMLEVSQSQYCKVLGLNEHELMSRFRYEEWEREKEDHIEFVVDTSINPDHPEYKEQTEWYLSNGYNLNIGDTIMAPVWGGGHIDRYGGNYPIYAVGYYEATEFCRLLSEKTGKKYTLPTEAQWEYAARGGRESNRTVYAGSNNIDEVAWYSNNSNGYVQVCGSRRPNELGIYDMCGNVSEWCLDCYLDHYLDYDINNPGAAAEEPDCSRIVRGGDFEDKAKDCRVSNRSDFLENTYYPYNVGFRVVLIR